MLSQLSFHCLAQTSEMTPSKLRPIVEDAFLVQKPHQRGSHTDRRAIHNIQQLPLQALGGGVVGRPDRCHSETDVSENMHWQHVADASNIRFESFGNRQIAGCGVFPKPLISWKPGPERSELQPLAHRVTVRKRRAPSRESGISGCFPTRMFRIRCTLP